MTNLLRGAEFIIATGEPLTSEDHHILDGATRFAMLLVENSELEALGGLDFSNVQPPGYVVEGRLYHAEGPDDMPSVGLEYYADILGRLVLTSKPGATRKSNTRVVTMSASLEDVYSATVNFKLNGDGVYIPSEAAYETKGTGLVVASYNRLQTLKEINKDTFSSGVRGRPALAGAARILDLATLALTPGNEYILDVTVGQIRTN